MLMSRRHLLAAMPLAAQSGAVPPIRGLSRTNLLEYKDASGAVRNASTPVEWQQRRREALAGMQRVTGPLPGNAKRCALGVKVQDETDMGGYVRRAIEYSSEPANRTTAFLCIPKTALQGKAARGAICLHPTDNRDGYRVVVGLGGRPHRQYASELAARGWVTISPSYPHLASYKPDIPGLGYKSGTMKAIWDNIRALDLLDSLPYVRRGYGAIGHSLGGHNAIYTAVFEPRIRTVVSSCGFDSFLDYYGGNIKGWVQERYMLRIGAYLGKPANVPFDFYELIAALAPRRVFVNAPKRDGNFKWDSVARIREAVLPVFRLHGAADALQVVHPDCDHDFPDEVREQAYAWMEG
ncbi:MAG: alpha/beta hydrolase [Acidobacteria bacterium]|nr:alpha/beta hydrolase [Acidobacteriota bacterium]